MKKEYTITISAGIAARELTLYADNLPELAAFVAAVEANLDKHIARGEFDAQKAAKAYQHITDRASKLYNRDFGYSFTVTERREAAAALAYNFMLERGIAA